MDILSTNKGKATPVGKVKFKDATDKVRGVIRSGSPLYQTGKKPCGNCNR